MARGKHNPGCRCQSEALPRELKRRNQDGPQGGLRSRNDMRGLIETEVRESGDSGPDLGGWGASNGSGPLCPSYWGRRASSLTANRSMRSTVRARPSHLERLLRVAFELFNPFGSSAWATPNTTRRATHSTNGLRPAFLKCDGRPSRAAGSGANSV
jgi:hypothetical protein